MSSCLLNVLTGPPGICPDPESTLWNMSRIKLTTSENPILKPGQISKFRQVLIRRKLKRLKRLARNREFTTNVLGPTIRGVDGLSFYYSFREIFEQCIYKFVADGPAPRIIDGGSNVGLSILYFKALCPFASIVGFEADPQVFAVLAGNIASCRLKGVELINKALWSKEETLRFASKGADAGTLVETNDEYHRMIEVEGCRLQCYLQNPVDMLKLDIEGAELAVLRDCADQLGNVRNLFVEYHSFSDQPQQLNELLDLLQNAGFRYQIQTQFASRKPFIRRESQSGMDMQLNIFAYREASVADITRAA